MKFLVCLVCSLAFLSAARGSEIPVADFTRPHDWGSPHHVKDVASSERGLSFTVTDEDPWFINTKVQFPTAPDNTKHMTVIMTCEPTECANSWQLFYSFGKKPFNQADSCHLQAVGKPPYSRFETEVPVPFCGSGPCSLRLDPPGVSGSFTVKGLAVKFHVPLWTCSPATPPPLELPASAAILNGDNWDLRHDFNRIGAFRFSSRGKTVEGNPNDQFVYVDRSKNVRSLDWSTAKAQVVRVGMGLRTVARMKDADGNDWELNRRFTPVKNRRALEISTQIKFNPAIAGAKASILHVPALTLFIDRGSGGHKRQAMLAGVEYLEDEPSSNKKEIFTEEYNRLISAEYRFSAPLAVFTDEKNWLAAEWNQLVDNTCARPGRPHPFATVFDTPDRVFKSGGHLLAFWAPAVGEARPESELSLYTPMPFSGASHSVTLSTGGGNNVADAIKVCITKDVLPPPDRIDQAASLAQLASGWLDSEIREGLKVKHAIGGHFKSNLVSDAPVLMLYLASALDPAGGFLSNRAGVPNSATLVARLRDTANEMLAAIPKPEVGVSGVSHVRRPAPELVAGDIPAALERRSRDMKSANGWFSSGKRIWKAPEGKADFGSTLGSDHCNGYSSMVLSGLLRNAVWSGDEAEISKTLAIVDKVTALYRGTVPRGAQPWEMPLHTPDIMASAHLVRSYTLAYQLKPDPAYLREARYWAYTGLSMVYLVPPPLEPGQSEDPVGRYATCGVMGATHWVAPNWIGRPVQWCGLVYSSALWDLARIVPEAEESEYWRTIAAGITASGVRQNHTAEEPGFVGLLPDSWNLMRQERFPIPINPGTVQENLAELVGMPFYSLRALLYGTDRAPSLLHLPGNSEALPVKSGVLRCRVAVWPESPVKAVVTRLDRPTAVTLDGQALAFEYLADRRVLVIDLPGRAKGEMSIGF